jgi:DnaK suppressor protein
MLSGGDSLGTSYFPYNSGLSVAKFQAVNFQNQQNSWRIFVMESTKLLERGHFKEVVSRLQERRQGLMNTKSAFEEEERQLAFTSIDERAATRYQQGDQATTTGDREFVSEMIAREIARINDIDDALAKIESGTYGLCEDCGSDIPFLRLEAVPETRYCEACAESHERTAKARRRKSLGERRDYNGH